MGYYPQFPEGIPQFGVGWLLVTEQCAKPLWAFDLHDLVPLK